MKAEDRYDSLFTWYGTVSTVDWLLLKAQARAESNMNPDARSKVGARGLAQFMANTWKEWQDGIPGIQEPPPADLVHLDPNDPEDCIRAQAAYMAWLLRQFTGDKRIALAAYNWGIGHVNAAGWQSGYENLYAKLPPETQMYVSRIMRYYSEYAAA